MDFNHVQELDIDRVDGISESLRLRLIYDILMESADRGGIDLHGEKPWEHLVVDVFCRHNDRFNKVNALSSLCCVSLLINGRNGLNIGRLNGT